VGAIFSNCDILACLTVAQWITKISTFKHMKQFTTFLTATAISLGGAQAAATFNNLLALYEFNGDTSDSSSNSATGTLTDGAVISADGTGYSGAAGDSALDLGASGGSARSVSTVDLSSSMANNALAVSFWQYDIGNGAGGNVSTTTFGIVDGGTGRGFGAHTPWGNGILYFDHAGCCNPPQRLTVNDIGTSLLDSWHHIVLQVDNGNKQIWVDGVMRAEQATGAAAIADLTGIVNVGAQYDDTVSFGGRVDEFAIWDAALDQTQIEALAGGASTLQVVGIPEPSSGLLVLLGSLMIARRRR
jgi:hypothetical protein